MVQIWLAEILPMKIIEILPALTLIIVGLIVEKYYVSRIAIVTNAVALSTFFVKVKSTPIAIIWYINILTILGIIALFSRFFKISLPKEFYTIAGIFSSLISGVILLYGIKLL